jgi:hypothetical protein
MKRVGLVSGIVFGVVLLAGCAGNDGATGQSGLTRVVAEAPGANCPAGGQAIEIGVDRDGNGQLDSSEVSGASYVCNGVAAQPLATEILPIAPGDPRCAHGGTALRIGSAGDVVACNGAPGAQGSQGDAGAAAPQPVLGQFSASQIVRGAVLTCASTSAAATTMGCNGLKINGFDVRLGAVEANAICGAITGQGYFSASGMNTVSTYIVESGGTWALGTSGNVSPMQNLVCRK